MTGREGVRTALVGYGYWGANLARNIVGAESLALVGVADLDPRRRTAAAASLPGIRTWTDFDEVLADGDVEAVVLATPATFHGAQARAVLESGRHLMVEKPLAMDVEEAEAVVRAADAAGRTAMVGHTFLYSPPVRYLRDLINAGDLGRIQYLYSQRLSLGRIRRDCNALWNFAPHDVAIMLYLLDDQAVEVSGRGLSFITPGIDDVCFATLAFSSGAAANLHVSWIDPRKTRTMTVVGDAKMAIYNDVSSDQKIWVVDAGVARSENPTLGEYASMGEFQWRTRAGDIVIPRIEMTEPLRVEMEAFGHSCRTGEPPVTDARHGLAVVRILAAIDESCRRGGAAVEVGR